MTPPTTRETLAGWGRYPQFEAETARPETREDVLRAFEAADKRPVLGRGMGRAYGDAAVSPNGLTLITNRLDRMLEFDPETGWLRCEAGVTISDLIATFLPRGFFPPVVPGTRFVSVGGALASDIHGKNHHVAGSFSDHVRQVEILTGDGRIRTADLEHESELFHATAGGMGLTGLILSMELKLIPVPSPAIKMESVRVPNLEAFFRTSEASRDFPYTVGWIDGMARGRSLGRGVFMRGDHAPARARSGRGLLARVPAALRDARWVSVPWALNPVSVRAFNAVYYRRVWHGVARSLASADSFFFPLDGILNWNRIYGPRGLLQYQFVVTTKDGHDRVRDILETISQSGLVSFLGVIKEFGERRHGGLSFPAPGVNVALDFPNVGDRLFRLLDSLDERVANAGGRVYLTKDARLSKARFREMYPEWREWKAVRDRFDSRGRFTSALGERLGLVDR